MEGNAQNQMTPAGAFARAGIRFGNGNAPVLAFGRAGFLFFGRKKQTSLEGETGVQDARPNFKKLASTIGFPEKIKVGDGEKPSSLMAGRGVEDIEVVKKIADQINNPDASIAAAAREALDDSARYAKDASYADPLARELISKGLTVPVVYGAVNSTSREVRERYVDLLLAVSQAYEEVLEIWDRIPYDDTKRFIVKILEDMGKVAETLIVRVGGQDEQAKEKARNALSILFGINDNMEIARNAIIKLAKLEEFTPIVAGAVASPKREIADLCLTALLVAKRYDEIRTVSSDARDPIIRARAHDYINVNMTIGIEPDWEGFETATRLKVEGSIQNTDQARRLVKALSHREPTIVAAARTSLRSVLTRIGSGQSEIEIVNVLVDAVEKHRLFQWIINPASENGDARIRGILVSILAKHDREKELTSVRDGTKYDDTKEKAQEDLDRIAKRKAAGAAESAAMEAKEGRVKTT